MAGKVANIKVYSPLKLYLGLTGKYHAICHYSYNLPLLQYKERKNILINIYMNYEKSNFINFRCSFTYKL